MVEPIKLCQCGCAQPTKIAKQSSTGRGQVKGQPMAFLQGHNRVRSKEEAFWSKVRPR